MKWEKFVLVGHVFARVYARKMRCLLGGAGARGGVEE